MRKRYNTLNEEMNRMKSLFTEERLYGNLVSEKEMINEAAPRYFKGVTRYIDDLATMSKALRASMATSLAKAGDFAINGIADIVRHIDAFPGVWKVLVPDAKKLADAKKMLTVIDQKYGKDLSTLNLHKVMDEKGTKLYQYITREGGVRDMVTNLVKDQGGQWKGASEALVPKKFELVKVDGSTSPVKVAVLDNGNMFKIDAKGKPVIEGEDIMIIYDKNGKKIGEFNTKKNKIDAEDIDYKMVDDSVPSIENTGDLVGGPNIKVEIPKGMSQADLDASFWKNFGELVEKFPDADISAIRNTATGQMELIYKSGKRLTDSDIEKTIKDSFEKMGQNSGNPFDKSKEVKSWWTKWGKEKVTKHFINPNVWGDISHNYKGTDAMNMWAKGKMMMWKQPLRIITMNFGWALLCGSLNFAMSSGKDAGLRSWCGLNPLTSFAALLDKIGSLFGQMEPIIVKLLCGVAEWGTENKDLRTSAGELITCDLIERRGKEIATKLGNMDGKELVKLLNINCEELKKEVTMAGGEIDKVKMRELIKNRMAKGYLHQLLVGLDVSDLNWVEGAAFEELLNYPQFKAIDFQEDELVTKAMVGCGTQPGTSEAGIQSAGTIQMSGTVEWEEDNKTNTNNQTTTPSDSTKTQIIPPEEENPPPTMQEI